MRIVVRDFVDQLFGARSGKFTVDIFCRAIARQFRFPVATQRPQATLFFNCHDGFRGELYRFHDQRRRAHVLVALEREVDA